MEFSHYSLRYFRAARYQTKGGIIDRYRLIPRPSTSIGFLVNGDWEYTEYIRSQKQGEYKNCGTVKSGQLLYVPFGATYDASWLTYPQANCISIHFELSSPGIFNQRATMVQAVEEKALADAVGITSMQNEFEIILDLFNRTQNGVKGLKFELLSRLYRIIGGLNSCLMCKEYDEVDEMLEPAIRYLQNAPEKAISVPELAKLCQISESYFYTRFHSAMGMTPIEYKNRLMISRAQSLLVDEPNMPIEVIVDKCGFSSSAYFRKIFKQISGCSPREYRMQEISSMGR